MKSTKLFLCAAACYSLGVFCHSSNVVAADEQVVEVRVKATDSNSEHESTEDKSTVSRHATDKTATTRAFKMRSLFLGKGADGGDVKLVHASDAASEDLITTIEKHLKKAGLKARDIEKVRDALQEHEPKKRNYWYYFKEKEDGKKDVEKKNASTATATILEWHSKNDRDYMIGLNSTAMGETLRSHLGIDKGALVVEGVMDESPAELAGLQRHDVIIKANDASVRDQAALINAVQSAGKESKSLKLSIIRGGKTQMIKVKPTERKAVRLEVKNLRDRNIAVRPNVDLHIVGEADFTAANPVQLKSVGPAYMIAGDARKTDDSPQSLKREISELGEQIQSLKKAIESLADRLPKD